MPWWVAGLGPSNGGDPLGLLGRSVCSALPGLRPAVVCGHTTTTPPTRGHPRGQPQSGKTPPGAEVLVLIYAFYSSLRRCYRSLRTEIKACILQVQIYCTYSFTVSRQGGSINLVTVKFLRKLVSSSWVILNWSLGEE